MLDAGTRDATQAWARVIDPVSAFCRVVLIERSATAESSAATELAQPDIVAGSLQAVLRDLGNDGPFVVAGWSIGAQYIAALSKLLPGNVLGMVLCDPVPAPALKLIGFDDPIWNAPEDTVRAPLVDLYRLASALDHRPPHPGWSPSAITRPATVLLPVSSNNPLDAASIRLSELQREDIGRFQDVQEVIAGRSYEEIPRERPDAVVDAIRRMARLHD